MNCHQKRKKNYVTIILTVSGQRHLHRRRRAGSRSPDCHFGSNIPLTVEPFRRSLRQASPDSQWPASVSCAPELTLPDFPRKRTASWRMLVSALALLGFAWAGTRWSADGQSGLAHPRPSVLCRRSVAGTLTPTATAVWPQTNAAGHFPFPVRGRAISRRPWWRCPHWTERLPAAGLAWAKQSSPPWLGLISRLPGWENWFVLFFETYFCSFSIVCFEAAVAAPVLRGWE